MSEESDLPTPHPPLGLAIAVFVLGLVSLTVAPLLLGFPMGLLGAILGLVYLRRRGPHRALAGWGTTLSLLGVIASVGVGFAYYLLYQRSVKLSNDYAAFA